MIYWATSLAGSLNIGLRHILPTFAFTYLLVVIGLKNLLAEIKNKQIIKTTQIFLGILLGGFIFSSITIFPHYLAYYNILAGGPNNGYKIAVDSNLDWGQDLKRLKQWIDKNNNYLDARLNNHKDEAIIASEQLIKFMLIILVAAIRSII